MNTKYSGTLESSRLDGKLAFTKDIFDNTNQKSQEQVNTDIKKDIVDNKKTLDDEITRAVDKDNTLSTAITTEKNRASDAELAIGNTINDEINRASEAETYIFNKQKGDVDALQLDITNINHTITDNKITSDEDSTKNASDIINEVNRATTKEFNIQKQIDNITVEPVDYEEVAARGFNDLNDRINDIGIQTPIMKRLVDWFDARDINYYDNFWYSRTSTNKIPINDLNVNSRPKENDITSLETILYNLANKQLLANNYSNYRTTSLLIGLNYESNYSGILFKINTPNKYIAISINESLLISVDSYNSIDDSFIKHYGTYQFDGNLLNLNINRDIYFLRIYVENNNVCTIQISEIELNLTPKDTVLSTGPWTDVTFKSILVYNDIISDSELIYNYNYFKSREYKLNNRISYVNELIPNNTKLLNDLASIKDLIATAIGVTDNKLIIINKAKGNKMYYGNTLTTNKNFIYAGPFDNIERFSVDSNPDPNMIEEVISLPTNINRTDFTKYFNACTNLKYINLSNLNTNSMTISKQMFMGCESLINLDVSDIKMNNVTDASFMFKGIAAKNIIGFSNWIMNHCTSIESIFENAYIKNFNDYQNWDVSVCTNFKSVFNNFINTEDTIDISLWNMINSTDVSMMFKGCRAKHILLSTIIGLNYTNYNQMFSDCINVLSLDISNLKSNKVTNFEYMFNNCNLITNLNLNYLDITLATTLKCMFKNCKSLSSIDLHYFIAHNVTDISDIFNGCFNATHIDTGYNKFENCINAVGMFDNCISISALYLDNIDTTNMITLPTFKNCNTVKELHLSSNYFKSAVITYDFSDLINFTDLYYINSMIESLSTNIIQKTLKLSVNTKALLTSAQLTTITNKNWILV